MMGLWWVIYVYEFVCNNNNLHKKLWEFKIMEILIEPRIQNNTLGSNIFFCVGYFLKNVGRIPYMEINIPTYIPENTTLC